MVIVGEQCSEWCLTPWPIEETTKTHGHIAL